MSRGNRSRRRLSVVVVANNSPLTALLTTTSVMSGSARYQVEGIVVFPFAWLESDAADLSVFCKAFDGVRWICAGPGASVSEMRKLGVDEATGSVIAFTEDCCLIPPDWIRDWLETFADDPDIDAAAGPVVPELEARRAIDWAVFCCEYAQYWIDDQSIDANISPILAGCNFAVRRDVAVECSVAGALRETDLDGRSGDAKGRYKLAWSRARAFHAGHYPFVPAVTDRFRFGREFGKWRRDRGDWRWLGLIAGPLIFLVQAIRLAATLARKPRHLLRSIVAAPMIVLLLVSWSLGEWLGWVLPRRRRPVGTSYEKVDQPEASESDQSETSQLADKAEPAFASRH